MTDEPLVVPPDVPLGAVFLAWGLIFIAALLLAVCIPMGVSLARDRFRLGQLGRAFSWLLYIGMSAAAAVAALWLAARTLGWWA
jgi:hypothetical protein